MSRPLPVRNQVEAPLASKADALALVSGMVELMAAMNTIIEEETGLVRAGRLIEATALADTKAELSKRYLGEMTKLRTNVARLREFAPDAVDNLKREHETFRAVLQINLAVLATVHAVSESVVRGVAEAVGQRSSPQGYGAGGRARTAPMGGAIPLSVSRTL